ncbi:MAG: PLP-dependent transferase, partial [Nocardioidaceae bacterium]
PALAGIAHDAGALLVVDNTFATPYNVRPLALGADLVVHSATKFLNGHSDAIAGVVVGAYDLVREVQRRVVTLGTCLDPHAAYLVWRGMQTFDLRLSRSNGTARTLAAALAACPDVVGVRHPSLPGYARAEVAERVLRRDGRVLRTGAMVSFTVEGGDDRALRMMRRLELACEATSLGGVETLVSTPFNSSHFSLSREERLASRIDDGMVRVSCGVEAAEALVADFMQALEGSQ